LATLTESDALDSEVTDVAAPKGALLLLEAAVVVVDVGPLSDPTFPLPGPSVDETDVGPEAGADVVVVVTDVLA
jgi:hypothetical protein